MTLNNFSIEITLTLWALLVALLSKPDLAIAGLETGGEVTLYAIGTTCLRIPNQNEVKA